MSITDSRFFPVTADWVAVKQLDSGTTRSVQDVLREVEVQASSTGALPDGSDAQAGINAAMAAVSVMGGGVVTLKEGTYIVGATLQVPDNVWLVGKGQKATIIKLKNSANTNIITKAVGHQGRGSGVLDLTIDGNEDNNTSGGVYWDGANTGRGPSITLERLTITKCRPIANAPSGESAAVLLRGAVWGVMRDVDIDQNKYAVGLWHKASDWIIESLYLGPNGNSATTHSMIVQGGAGNRFSNCYFGGNGGLIQVLLWGTQRNLFINCLNDNSWQHAYQFIDLAGTPSSDNVFVGGQLSSAGWSANNTYSGFDFTGGASNNLIEGIKFLGLQANKAKYAIHEQDTASNNLIVGCTFDANWGTAINGLRSGSGSKFVSCLGIDDTKTRVQGPYDSNAPSASSVPLGRWNNGGAVSVWVGARGYTNGWIQAIQDDGSNSVKDLQLNPLGGRTQSGGNHTPITDNVNSLGEAGGRWSVVYAGTGTINTSDAREKQQVRELSDAEKAVAVRLKSLVRLFKFNDAVEQKGEVARIHCGVIAQDVKAAFEAEGLEAESYAVLCHDEWEGGDRYGVRYDQLLAFIIAAI